MAIDQYFSQEWKPIPNAETEAENSNDCFNCNICLDFAHEPVVTLCGHLYCWPCIYKWLHVQSASIAPDEHPQCPVCKDDICHTRMVPLYGRGQALARGDRDGKTPRRGICIPRRPSAFGAQSLLATRSQSDQQQLPYRNPYQSQHFDSPLYQEEDDTSQQMLNLGATITPGFPHLVVGMFEAMFCTRVFGNSENLPPYPNSYHLMGSESPRLRRQEMHADKSLNRISIFLFCCFILCLIVF